MSELCDTCRVKLQAIAIGEEDRLTATERTAFDEINLTDQKGFKGLLFDLVRDPQEHPQVRSTAINILAYRLGN